MDDLLVLSATKNLRVSRNLSDYQRDTIDRTSSFEYAKFRDMAIKLIGLVTMERIEDQADPAKLTLLKSTLSLLKTPRNTEAHTHTVGITRALDAPSLTRSRLRPIYKGLREIERLLDGATFTV